MRKNYSLSGILTLALMLVSLMIYAQPADKTIIFVGADADAARPEDSVAIDSIAQWVTSVVYMGQEAFNTATADALYGDAGTNADGVVISESIGSTGVPSFGLRDNYPVPVIIMEGVLTNDPASTEKWPLLLPAGGYWGYATPAAVDVQWKIVNDEHYITEGYTLNQIINYAPTADRGVPYVHGIDATHTILATAARTEGGTDNPSFVQAEAIALGVIEDPAILYMNVAYTYLAVGSTDFYNILHRSCEFMFDFMPPSSVNQLQADEINLSVFPNPSVSDASVSFSIEAGRRVSVSIFSVTGGLVGNVYEGVSVAGKNVVHLNTANYTPGIYFVELNLDNQVAYTKLVVQ